MIPFTAYIAVETPNAFQWAEQPSELPLTVGQSRLPDTHGSLDPHKSSRGTISTPWHTWFLGPT